MQTNHPFMSRWGALGIVVLLAPFLGCGTGSSSEKDAGPTTDSGAQNDSGGSRDSGDNEDAGSDAEVDAGPWVNPGCSAAENVVADDLRLQVRIDLKDYAQGIYHVKETLTVKAPAAGEAVSLFGEQFALGRASAGYEYDQHTATFCTGPFAAGDDVIVKAEFDVDESVRPNMLAQWGLHRWDGTGGEVVVGAFNEPYYAPYWLLVPESFFNVDKVHDDSPAVSGVDLTIVAPDDTWTVVGPGGPAQHTDQAPTTWSFSLHQAFPLYAFSFAASPDYEIFSAGKTQSGVEVLGAVPASLRATAETVFPSAVQAIDWMEQNLGLYDFGEYLTLAAVPGFGGGMENATIIWLGDEVITPNIDGTFVAVHETVHHWWGDNVRFTDWPHFWLAEGFDEWTTNFNLMAEFMDDASFAARKATYRTDAADLATPRYAGLPDPGPLRFPDDQNMMNHFVYDLDLFYKYGASFLAMVDQRLQRDFATNLLEVLGDWFAERQHTSATTEEFLAFLQDATGDEATWPALFNDWVYKTPCPTLTASGYSYASGQVSFTLKRSGGDQDLTGLEIDFGTGGTPHPVTVDLPAGTDTVTVSAAVASEPDRIAIDPDGFFILRLRTDSSWTGPAVSLTMN